LQYGFGIMRKFLDGAHAMDKHFETAPLESNLPVMLGMMGLWNSSFLGHVSRAVLPYSQALLRFPAHLQQVDMESNGKSVNLAGIPLPFQTGEIVFGEPGTNGQHRSVYVTKFGTKSDALILATSLPLLFHGFVCAVFTSSCIKGA